MRQGIINYNNELAGILTEENTAQLLGGKKMNFNKGYFDRLGVVLKLNEKQISGVYKRLEKWLPKANLLIEKSFLNEDLKKDYLEMVTLVVQKFSIEITD